jgi:hypothetical protein
LNKIVVLIHKSGVDETPVVDVLVHRSSSKRFIRILERMLDEPANCKYVEEFIKENQEYIHVGSIDFLHDYEYNSRLVETLLWLGRRRDVLPESEVMGAINKAHLILGDEIYDKKKAMPLIFRLVREEAEKHGNRVPKASTLFMYYKRYIERIKKNG